MGCLRCLLAFFPPSVLLNTGAPKSVWIFGNADILWAFLFILKQAYIKMERCVLATTIPSLKSSAWGVATIVISRCVLSTFQGILINKKRQSESEAMVLLPFYFISQWWLGEDTQTCRPVLKTVSLKVSKEVVLNWLLFSCSSLLTGQNGFPEKEKNKKETNHANKTQAFLLLITFRYLVQYIGLYYQNLYIGSSYWDNSDLSFIVRRMTSPYLFWGSWKRSQKLLVCRVQARLLSRKNNDGGGIFP